MRSTNCTGRLSTSLWICTIVSWTRIRECRRNSCSWLVSPACLSLQKLRSVTKVTFGFCLNLLWCTAWFNNAKANYGVYYASLRFHCVFRHGVYKGHAGGCGSNRLKLYMFTCDFENIINVVIAWLVIQNLNLYWSDVPIYNGSPLSPVCLCKLIVFVSCFQEWYTQQSDQFNLISLLVVTVARFLMAVVRW